MSRLYDRVRRRASPGLDTDRIGLVLGFICPGNVRKLRTTASSTFQTGVAVRFLSVLVRYALCVFDLRPIWGP